MNFQALILLICSISSTFGGLIQSETKHKNMLDGYLRNKYHDFQNSTSPIFEMLTPDIFLHVFEYLDNPIFDLLYVCKLFNAMLENNWIPNQRNLFRSLNIYPAFKRIESDAEIHHLLKIDVMVLNDFFDYFVYSSQCIDLMNNFIKKSNSFNQIIFEYWIDGAISNNFNTDEEVVEWFARKVVNIAKISYLIIYNFTLIDKNHRLYEKSRSIVKALLRRWNYDEYTSKSLFQSQLSAKDIEYLLRDYAGKNSVILDNIRRMALELEMDYTVEEKVLFRLRNYQLLSNLTVLNRVEEREKFNAKILTTIRYSVISDNGAIMEEYFTGKGFAFYVDLNESFAIAAIQAKNIDLFLKIYQLRISRKFSVEFYRKVARSKNLIEIIPNDALLNFFEVPESELSQYYSYQVFDWTLRFEFLARMSVDERVFLIDLESLFSNDELGILFALALYYPMDQFIDRLGRNMEYIYDMQIIFYYIEYRNNLNDPLTIFYESFKSIDQIDNRKARSSIKELFEESEFVEKCIEPENSTILAYLIDRMGDKKIDICCEFTSMLRNSKFKLNLADPLIAELAKNLTLGFLMISIELLQFPKDIILICDALDLQIGDFNFADHLEGVYHSSSQLKLNNLKGKNLDKFLVERALYDFQRKVSNNYYNGNPMHLVCFPIFQLWWQRNPESFEKFAPAELVQDFKAR